MAEAGIGHAALIVLAAVALILMAVLAAIGICERCHVQSGGVYFLISHVLGSRRGTAVGILYVLGQVWHGFHRFITCKIEFARNFQIRFEVC